MLINGRNFQEMSESERNRQHCKLLRTHQEVENRIATLDFSNKEVIIDELARCMNSFEYWCNHYAFTFDPRKMNDAHPRFILYEYQIETARITIDAIDTGKILVEDKSRDMGASWLKMLIFTWMWLFRPIFHAHVGSRKEDLVDNSTVDSLFGKIDFVLERLPLWMLQGYTRNKHRMKLKIEHPRGNLITGESSNKNFGRGPRKNVVYLDEYAFWEEDRAVWVGISDTAPCKIVTSTPYGKVNQFATLRFGKNSNTIVNTMHWSLHPYKDQEWYDKEKASRGGDTVGVAQELDIDYDASAGGLALPQLVVWEDSIVIPSIHPSDGSNVGCKFYGGFDWGSTSPTSFNVYRVRKISTFPDVFSIDSVWEYYRDYYCDNPLLDFVKAYRACPWVTSGLLEEVYADPSIWFYNQQTLGGATSLAFMLRDDYGITSFRPGRKGDTVPLEKVRAMWESQDSIRLHISVDCPHQIREWKGLRYEMRSSFMTMRKNVSDKLVDKDNHSWDNFKYFINSRFDAEDPVIAAEPVILGYDKLQREMSGLKKMKLEGMQPRRPRRRLFQYT